VEVVGIAPDARRISGPGLGLGNHSPNG